MGLGKLGLYHRCSKTCTLVTSGTFYCLCSEKGKIDAASKSSNIILHSVVQENPHLDLRMRYYEMHLENTKHFILQN